MPNLFAYKTNSFKAKIQFTMKKLRSQSHSDNCDFSNRNIQEMHLKVCQNLMRIRNNFRRNKIFKKFIIYSRLLSLFSWRMALVRQAIRNGGGAGADIGMEMLLRIALTAGLVESGFQIVQWRVNNFSSLQPETLSTSHFNLCSQLTRPWGTSTTQPWWILWHLVVWMSPCWSGDR